MEIEVTESSLFSDDDKAYEVLRTFNDHGLKVAIDDFGTGYSSLARLGAFPFHKLKIDARFVASLDKEARVLSQIFEWGISGLISGHSYAASSANTSNGDRFSLANCFLRII